MVYSIKDYKTIFNTPAKREQELAIASKIMDLVNKKKFDDLDEFISKNQSYKLFLKDNTFENVIKHFGNTLSEEDFKQILDNLKILTKTKQDFNEENIKTTKIDEKEYNTFKGEDKTYYIDNSNSNKSIEDQLKDLQPTQQDFQTADINKNTENMFKELEENKKNNLNFKSLNEINIDLLNNDEKALLNVVIDYAIDNNITVKIDLQNSVFIDDKDKIMKIQKENDNFIIKGDENENTNKMNTEKVNQKQFVLKPSTIYSDRKES